MTEVESYEGEQAARGTIMAQPPPRTLLNKLHEAQKAAKTVSKQGENTAQHYRYARAEDVIREAQGALQGAGLIGFPVWTEISEREITSGGGTAGLFVSVRGALRILDPETGESLDIEGFGAGIDYPGDKAVYKAKTGGAKYAYAGALGIPFGDDPEDESTASAAPEGRRLTGAATVPQKRAVSTVFNRVGVPPEMQTAIVHAIAGDPPTKAGMTDMLDVLKDETRGSEDERVDFLYSMAELGRPQESDVPGETEGLPEIKTEGDSPSTPELSELALEEPTAEMMFDPEEEREE